MTITYIDLRHENLYGWEHRKLRGKIEGYARAAREGTEFPPVPVQKVEDGYELCMNVFKPETLSDPKGPKTDGGHSRALAHYLAGMQLKVELVETTRRIDPQFRKNIRDLILVETEAQLWE